MHRISAEPAKAHVCYQLSPPNTKSHANAHFIAFDIDKHAVLGNFVIHLAFYRKKKRQKQTSATRLFLWCFVIYHDYVLFF